MNLLKYQPNFSHLNHLGSKFLIYIYKSQKDRPQTLPSKKKLLFKFVI